MPPTKKKRFLIAVDDSNSSRAVVQYVAQMKLGLNASLVLINIFDHIPRNIRDLECDPRYNPWLTAEALEARQHVNMADFMAQARTTLLEAGVPETAIETRIQDRKNGIARDIIAEAKKGYQAVIVGRIGAGHVPGMVMGTVAQKIMASLTGVTVCLVAGQPQPQRILVAIDSSQGAERAIDFLPMLINGTSQDVTLFHAFRGDERFFPNVNHHRSQDPNHNDLLQEHFALINPIIEQAINRLSGFGINRERVSVKTVTNVFSRAVAIVDEANSGPYATIVVGRRGLSMVREYFIGRVSSKVVQLAQNAAVWIIK